VLQLTAVGKNTQAVVFYTTARVFKRAAVVFHTTARVFERTAVVFFTTAVVFECTAVDKNTQNLVKMAF